MYVLSLYGNHERKMLVHAIVEILFPALGHPPDKYQTGLAKMTLGFLR
jgi:hypothetical protein